MWLDVPVDDWRLLLMQVFQRIEKLVRPLQYHLRRKRAAVLLEQHREVIAGDVLHDQELPRAFCEIIEDYWQRRMTQFVEELRFAFERLAQIVAIDQGLLQGDGAAEAKISGLVDSSHSTLTERTGDAITVLQDRTSGLHT